MPHEMTPERAQAILDNLVLACQGFGIVSLRQRWTDVFVALTGEEPTRAMLDESDL